MIPLILAVLSIWVSSANADSNLGQKEALLRSKRQINGLPLVFPYGGTYKFIIGFGTPIKFKEKYNLAFGANFQYQYVQFQNITELSRYYFIKTVAREEREIEWQTRADERLVFYQAFEKLLDSKGMNGEDCMLRAICEAAQYPVEDEGLIGEVMHILLTPDYGKSPFDIDADYHWSMGPYLDAATAGRQMFSCASIYTGCPEGSGVMELVSILKNE